MSPVDESRPATPSDLVLVMEPLLPQRLRRPSDALRFFATLLALVAVVLLALVAQETLRGLESDVTEGTARVPGFLAGFAGFIGGAAVLVVPVGFAVERVFHRDGLRVAEGLIAAIAGMLVSFGLGEWLVAYGPDDLHHLFTGDRSNVEPLNTLLTSVIAYATAVRINRRPTWRMMMWTAVAFDVLALFTGVAATVLGVLVTVLVGMAVGFAILYGIGSPNTRPPGSAVVASLRRLGFEPAGARRIEDDTLGSRRYVVGLRDGRRLDVTVIDRDRQVAGVLYRMWRRLRLNTEARRAIRSLRAELEREALMAYAAQAAGANIPRLLGTAEIGTDAAMLAYEHIDSRPLEEVPDEELDDEVLARIWEQVRIFHDHRLAHRHLTGESIHLAADGRILLLDTRSGEIAAGDLLLRLDIAQLLAYLGLRVGPERAVASGVAVLGPDAIASALPLLQRIALSRGTRAAVARTKELLPSLREQIAALKPQAPVQEEVRLERFRPRTLVTTIAGAVAAYFLLSQLSQVDVGVLLSEAQWGWAAVAVAAAVLSYVSAAVMLMGFVPEKLPLGRTVMAQFAGSFVKLVAPAAVGTVAINTRFLQKRGIPPGPAVASVGASQLVGLGSHISLLLLFGYITGSQAAPTLTPSRGLVIALLAVAVLILVVIAVPPLRRLVTTRLRKLFSGVVPRLLDVLQTPRKITEAVGGTVMLTLSFVICLYACVSAFGGDASFTAVAVVFLAGNAIGSAAPTPGGLVAVEGALVFGLTAAGVPYAIATSAVLLYRLLTFWLPVLPGWASFTWLQRHDAI